MSITRFVLLFSVSISSCLSIQAQLVELDRAVREGDIRRVTKLLKDNPELARSKMADGWSPFLLGARRGETNMAELFLSYGADVRQTNSDGRTALHLAAERRSLIGVKALLKAKADVNARDRSRMTPLHTLSSSVGEGPSVPIAELLLLHKADPNATSDLGNTILHTASVVGDTPLVSLLLEQGADPAITNKGGFNPMMFAGLNNRTNIMRLFEERGMHLRKVTFNFEPSDIRSNSVHVEYRQTLNFALVKQKELEFRAFARTNVGARLHVQIKGQEAWNQIMNGSVPLQITQRFSQAGEADKWAAQLVGGTKYRSSPSQSRSRSKPPGNQTKVSNTAVVQL